MKKYLPPTLILVIVLCLATIAYLLISRDGKLFPEHVTCRSNAVTTVYSDEQHLKAEHLIKRCDNSTKIENLIYITDQKSKVEELVYEVHSELPVTMHLAWGEYDKLFVMNPERELFSKGKRYKTKYRVEYLSKLKRTF